LQRPGLVRGIDAQIAHGDTFHDEQHPELDDAVQIEARQYRSGN